MLNDTKTVQRRSFNHQKVGAWLQELPLKTQSLKVCLTHYDEAELFHKV